MVVSPLGNMFLVGGGGCARCVVISLLKCVLSQSQKHSDSTGTPAMIPLCSAMFFAATWSSSVASVHWTELLSSGDTPVGRQGHAMVVLDDGTAVVFGGWADLTFMDDVYKLIVSGMTATWTKLSSSGDSPTGRSSHAMAVLDDGTAVVFGGVSAGGRMNDIYQLALSDTSATWVELSSSGDIPSGRSGHAMAVLSDGIAVMFGGWDGPSSTYAKNDIYSLVVSGATATWVELFSSGDTPVGRSGSLHGGAR